MLRSSSGLRKLALDRLVPAQSLDQLPICTRLLSSMPPKKKGSDKASASSSGSNEEFSNSDSKPKQPFVTANLSPGEWDMNRTDPFFRPRPSKQANFISAEDFANRPPVGFDLEFHSYQDAMISLSWMDQKTCRAIYSNYVDMMVMSQQKHQVTSHEYVTRVIAQKYQITPSRAAGIIQLQHAEEQMRQHSPELLCDEQAKYAEETIQENIRDAYRAERRPGQRGDNNPNQSIPFIEDPVGIHGRGEPDETSTSWTKADDMYDMEQKLEQANVRDEDRARLLIDGHVYQQDKDESQEPVGADSTCRRLIKANEKHQKEQKDDFDKSSGSIPYPETNAKGERRDRWKFVAKVVNTRNAKKENRRSSGYTNNSIGNTLVEHNGELRVATVEEAKKAAWKNTRTRSKEYLYEGAKKAWLDKTLNGKTNVWGAPPKTRASDATAGPEINKAKKSANATVDKDPEEGQETSVSPAVEGETDESKNSEEPTEEVKEDTAEGETAEEETKTKE